MTQYTSTFYTSILQSIFRTICALSLLMTFSYSSQAAQLGAETIPATETEDMQRAFELSKEAFFNTQQSPSLHQRGLHPKHHGCLNATFEINSNVPSQLAKGLFAREGQEYMSYVRFSNGAPNSPDRFSTVNGVALKLLGVDGEKNLGQANTQDFLLADSPVFFLRDVPHLIQTLAERPSLGTIFSVLGIAKPPEEGIDYSNRQLLNKTYWSQAPYLLGEGNAAKFRLQACASNTQPDEVHTSSFNVLKGLRNAIFSSENPEDQCFDFQVQRQVDAEQMPIENFMAYWSEDLSPYVSVAKLYIPQGQDPASAHAQAQCEFFSFNPWHSLVEHRPLGSLSRLRKSVYEKGSRTRRLNNGVVPREPTQDDAVDIKIELMRGEKSNGYYYTENDEGRIALRARLANNSASRPATGPRFVVALPEGIEFLSSDKGTACEKYRVGLRCVFAGELAAGEAHDVNLVLSASEQYSSDEARLFARASSNNNESDWVNNESEGLFAGRFNFFTSITRFFLGLFGF